MVVSIVCMYVCVCVYIYCLSNVVICLVLILTMSLLKCHQISRGNFNRNRGTDEAALFSREFEDTKNHPEMGASNSSSFHPSNYKMLSKTAETSLNSAQVSEYEDAESGACIVYEL